MRVGERALQSLKQMRVDLSFAFCDCQLFVIEDLGEDFFLARVTHNFCLNGKWILHFWEKGKLEQFRIIIIIIIAMVRKWKS